MAPDRWVVLDDTSPDIKYNGSWFSDFGSQDQIGNYGPPYLYTLHGTTVDGTVEFEFNGSSLICTYTPLTPMDVILRHHG